MPSLGIQKDLRWRLLPLSTLLALLLVLFCLHSSLHANDLPEATSLPLVVELLPELDTTLLQASRDFHGQDLSGKDGPLEKIGFDLVELHAEYAAYIVSEGEISTLQATVLSDSIIHTASDDYVVIDAIADEDAAILLDDLELLGLRFGESFGAVVSGQLPILKLPEIAELVSLRFARASEVMTDAGVAVSQADRVLGTELARSQLNVDGSGKKVGVLSDSYDCLGGEASDIASGDVPPDVQVLAEEAGCARGKDEGRALVQVVADIAPGAEQAFHTAFGGQAVFANGIVELAEVAQADVIVDDVRYLMEPMFQDGILAQAVNQVVAAGVPYFASAGNNARQAYESPFVTALGILPIEVPLGILHDFDPSSGVDPLQRIMIPVGATATFNLQWDQPYASATGGEGAASDLDMLLLGLTSTSPLAVAIDKNVGRDPIEVLRYTNPGPGTTFDLAIVHMSGPMPTRMKYIYTGNEITIEEYATQSGTVYGHASAKGARAVGAAFYLFTPAYDIVPPVLELSSSVGPVTIFYDGNDTRVNEVRQKPEIIAPDGINTTFFGTDIGDPGDDSDSDTYPNFFGTSAAAPNAAAVATLLLAVNPMLTPGQVYALLEGHAIDMDAAGVDDFSGYGLIQATPALEEVVAHDLVMTQNGLPANALPGQVVDYAVTITNLGPNPTRLVSLSNIAPDGLQDVVAVASPLATNSLATTAMWSVNNLAGGQSQVVTVTGRIDAALIADANFVNQSTVTSAGDHQLENNQSQATISVRVPRVQFISSEAEGEVGGKKIYRISLDQANPYAAVTLHYTTSSSKAGTGYVPVSGVVTVAPGETTATISVPNNGGSAAAGESITLQLSQPTGAMLGSRTAVVVVSNPDGDDDGVPDDDDEEPVDSCQPDPQADACDQEPDGLTNEEERLLNTDPTNPDSDGDGINDGDEVKNGSDPIDQCDPTPNASGCVPDDGDPDGGDDTDRDGISDEEDFDPLDPCVPIQDNPACQPAPNPNGPTEQLYLPGIRGMSTP